MNKICSKCNIEKPIDGFSKNRANCKACDKEYREQNKDKMKEYREKNRDKISKQQKEYSEQNKERIKEYREKNRDKMLKQKKEYNEQNKDKAKEYYERRKERISKRGKEHYKQNKERIKEYQKQNREKISKQDNKRRKERRKNDPIFKLTSNLRTRINAALKRNSKSAGTEKLLGCKVEFFKSFLEKQFTKKMTWENHGEYWHVDHIRPLASFDLSKPEQQNEAFHYTNCQPLEAVDNLSKSDSWDGQIKMFLV